MAIRHSDVSELYARALDRSQQSEGSCAVSAAYGADAVADYAAAARSSFGCGNPLAFEAIEPGQVVLDLGSGAGLDLLIAADRVGPTGRVIGVDMTDEMIAAARANAERAGKPQVEVRKGMIEQLPIEDASVDWVISNCVINLSPDKPAVFREVARVLAPGGRFSISDLVVEGLPEWLRGHVEAHAACIAGAIPEAEYLQGLRDAGLADVCVAERVVFDEGGLRALVANEIAAFELPEALVSAVIAQVVGKVASVRVTGRRADM